MEELVDKILEITFQQIDDAVFPVNELFGLKVEYENFQYEFLLKNVENCPTLTTIASAAFNRNTKYERSRPWFNRWSWSFEGSTLFFHDPTLYLSDEIFAPWGVGTPDVWYLEKIAVIIEKLAQKLQIKNEDILFFGSSAGGFTSLVLSVLIKNTVALADVPQFDITKWGSHWKPIKNASFDMDTETFIEKYNERLNIMTLIKKENYVPNAYILMDCSVETDFSRQYMFFLKELNDFKYEDEGNTMKLVIYGKNIKHAPTSQKNTLLIMKNIRQIEYNKKHAHNEIQSPQELLTQNKSYEQKINSLNNTHKLDQTTISQLENDLNEYKVKDSDYSKIIKDNDEIINELEKNIENIRLENTKKDEIIKSLQEENDKIKNNKINKIIFKLKDIIK